MTVLFLILLIAGLVCFIAATLAVRVGSPTRTIDLVALGLAFWISVEVIQRIRNLG